MGLSASEAYRRAGKGRRVIGWKVAVEARRELLQMFSPRYPQIVADHVTLKIRAASESALPCETTGEIVGRADDGKGVEALVVRIGGTSDRPDGSIYHITWSLGEGREAKESNDVIAAFGWDALDLPQAVDLVPAIF